MLKVLYQKLRLSSKGNLNHNNYSNLSKLQLKETRKLDKVGRAIIQGIPVLSIFALVGIAICSFVCVDKLANSSSMANFASFILSSESNKAYAEEGITALANTSASLTVDDGKIKDTIFATSGEFAYASHKITIEANNIKSYSLTLTRNIDLTGPTGGEGNSGVVGANGKTPDQMDNAWGYAFINDGVDPTSATYQTLASSNTLSGPAIDGNHNLSGSKQLVFGAKFGSSAMSGTYHAEATLSLVATPYVVVNYSLAYHANNGTGAPTTQTYADDTGAASHIFTISSTIPTRSGYKFLGWAESSTATTAQYAANGSITLPATAPAKTIYAVWQQDLNWNNITNMQQMTAEICDSAAVGATKTLTDTRDTSTYTIRKHEDNNCWMTQNLRLLGGRTLSSDDSDVKSNWAMPATIIGSNNQVSGWGNSNTAVQSAYFGSSTNGAYYSWCAATATSCTDDSDTPIAAGANVTSSICPKGWRLPLMNGSDSYSGLLTAAGITSSADGSTTIRNSTYNFLFAGDVDNGSLGLLGSRGRYWSSTALDNDRANALAFDNTYVGSAGAAKRGGLSVRCVVRKPTTYTLSYAYSGKYVSGLPAAQTVTSSEEAYTFTIPSSIWVWNSLDVQNACGGPVASFIGDDGVTYTPGNTVTLTESKPTITLTIKSASSAYCN